jgi:hypothetical protein
LWTAAAAAKGGALPPSTLDFTQLIPRRFPRRAAFTDAHHHLWDPAMVQAADGSCHLLYSRWPKQLGFDAWATHSQIAWASAERPEGPYRFREVVLPYRGAEHWDGHSVYNACLLAEGGKFYLYYTGNHGAAAWAKDHAPSMKDESWWVQRNNQRVGVAVADHPGGPWKRFERPLVDTGEGAGMGITAVPNVIARRGGGFLMFYKTLAPGPGRFGGGVVHYIAAADGPLGPFRRVAGPMVDKRKILGTDAKFNFHIDDHVEWFQDDRYYAMVKDHDAPFMSSYGRSLLLMESADGLSWRLSNHTLAKDFSVTWEDGGTLACERLEMPKLHFQHDRPATLLLAAKAAGDAEANSFLLVIPLQAAP